MNNQENFRVLKQFTVVPIAVGRSVIAVTDPAIPNISLAVHTNNPVIYESGEVLTWKRIHALAAVLLQFRNKV